MVKLDSIFVNSGKQEGNTERSTHEFFFCVFREHKAQVTNALCEGSCLDRFVECEAVVLGLHTGTLHKSACVRSESRVGSGDVTINLHNLLNAGRLEERRVQTLLDSQNYTLGGFDADGSSSQFDGLDSIFHLKQTALG